MGHRSQWRSRSRNSTLVAFHTPQCSLVTLTLSQSISQPASLEVYNILVPERLNLSISGSGDLTTSPPGVNRGQKLSHFRGES